MLLEGLHIPLTTPFHSDGRLNTRKLASNIARYSKTPAAGLIVLGPSAEPTLLSDDETHETLRIAAESAAPEKVLIVGISRDSVRSVLALADFATELNYDAILIGLPSVLTVGSSTREHLTWFQTIADSSPLPIILLSTSARSISTNAIVELAAHPNIIALFSTDSTVTAEVLTRSAAIQHTVTVTPTFAAVTARMKKAASKNAATNLVSASSLTSTAIAEPLPESAPLRSRTKAVSFQIITANTPTMLGDLNAGAIGIAPAFAACAPQASFEVFAAWKDSDQPLAAEKQSRLIEAAHLAEAGPGSLKFACDLNGYFGGPPRLPHLPPTGEQRTALEVLMQPLRN